MTDKQVLRDAPQERSFAERVAKLNLQHLKDGSVLLSYNDYEWFLACIREQQAALLELAMMCTETTEAPFPTKPALDRARATLAKWRLP